MTCKTPGCPLLHEDLVEITEVVRFGDDGKPAERWWEVEGKRYSMPVEWPVPTLHADDYVYLASDRPRRGE